VLVIDENIVLTIVEVIDGEVCFKIEIPEGTPICLQEELDYAI
jgi:hypothetical protein